MYTSRDSVYTFNDIHIYGQILNRWVNLSYSVLEVGRGFFKDLGWRLEMFFQPQNQSKSNCPNWLYNGYIMVI